MASVKEAAPETVAASAQAVPPLEQGDRLTRAEFERRYEAMPPSVKAELIEGRVYMAAAVRAREHGGPHGDLVGWLWTYKLKTPGIELYDNTTLRLDMDNAPQPDAMLCLPESAGGNTRVEGDGYLNGSPELVAEVAASSASYDLHEKLDAYRRNGVQEYLVWLTLDREVRWYHLDDGRYVLKAPDQDGFLKSAVFPGLWLDANALLDGNLVRVLEALNQGTATSEKDKR